jgi:structural maintenance of chromosome 2
MAYVFGDTLICKDKDTANKLTFNKAVGVRTVTLEGDTYEPSGALSGGSAPNSSGIIIKIQELRALERQIALHRGELQNIDKELYAAKSTSDAYRKAKRDLDLKQHEVSLLEQQVQGSSSAKVIHLGVYNAVRE